MQLDYTRAHVSTRSGRLYIPWVRPHPGRKRTASGGCWYRNIRTTAERRANQDWPVRAKRRPNRLPEAWDDVMRGDLDDRSWKRHRRAQWKART